ncbi:hypothetical protein IMPERIA89_400040 [Imperialibacter sp. 89]|nr:hypothetical protein IMPERIA89_400040 [Imperialibacter sp. 89]
MDGAYSSLKALIGLAVAAFITCVLILTKEMTNNRATGATIAVRLTDVLKI